MVEIKGNATMKTLLEDLNGILEGFEEAVNENENDARFRTLYRFPRTEKLDDVPFKYWNDENCKYKYFCDIDMGYNEASGVEKRFVVLVVIILKCKILEFYEKIKDQIFTEEQIREMAEREVFNILSIPYVGYFDSLDTMLATDNIDSEYIYDGFYNFSFETTDKQDRFVRKLYQMFKEYIRKQKKVQLLSEKPHVNRVGKCIKEAFDSCETIEQKLTLARAYAFDRKNKVVTDGKELLRLLGIRPHKNWCDEEKLLYHYVMAIYYARPTLCHIVELNGNYALDMDNDPGWNIDYLMYRARGQRKAFERIRKRMGINVTPPDDNIIIRANTNAMLDGIVAVKTIEREGGVGEVRNYEPKPIIEHDSQFDGDWDLTYGV